MTIYEIGDIIERLPNRDPYDPEYDYFCNENTKFLINDIITEPGKFPIYCILSLKLGEITYITILDDSLWRKLS